MSAPAAREVLLARLRRALVDCPEVPTVPRDYRRQLDSQVDLVARFSERLEDYRAVVHRVEAGVVGAAVASILANFGPRTLVVPPGTPASWIADVPAKLLEDEPLLSVAELDGAGAVISGCAVAIAETGTIVLDGGPAQGRRALTLLPDHHLCVVGRDQIVGDVPEGVASVEPGRPLTWISGPSATSDIELQRVEGVHGPRNLYVLIVESGDH